MENKKTIQNYAIFFFLLGIGTIVGCHFMCNYLFVKKFHSIFVLLASFFLLISICFFLKDKFKWGYKWFFPFFNNTNNSLITAAIFFLAIFIPIGVFFYQDFMHDSDTETSFISNWGIFLSFIGILVGMKVYMEFIENKHKHNFKEFIDVLCNLFDEAKPSDEICLLLPTLHIGAAGKENKKFSRKFKISIKRFIEKQREDGAGKLNIGVLDYNIDAIRKFKTEYEKIEYSNLEKEEKSELFTILDWKESLLLQFHRLWNDVFVDYSEEEFDFYYDLSCFMVELDDELLNKDTKLKIDKLTKKYFSQEDNKKWKCTRNSREGLFLYANKSQNIIYFGNIYINAQEQIEFQNTIIKDLPVGEEFLNLYDNFVKNRS
jgi:hypothetical protein